MGRNNIEDLSPVVGDGATRVEFKWNSSMVEVGDDGTKIMLLGEIGVGKSSIAQRLVFNRFETIYKPTLGVDVYTYDIETETDADPVTTTKFIIWDTDGELVLSHIYIKEAGRCSLVRRHRAPHDVLRVELGTSWKRCLGAIAASSSTSRIWRTLQPSRPQELIEVADPDAAHQRQDRRVPLALVRSIGIGDLMSSCGSSVAAFSRSDLLMRKLQ